MIISAGAFLIFFWCFGFGFLAFAYYKNASWKQRTLLENYLIVICILLSGALVFLISSNVSLDTCSYQLKSSNLHLPNVIGAESRDVIGFRSRDFINQESRDFTNQVSRVFTDQESRDFSNQKSLDLASNCSRDPDCRSRIGSRRPLYVVGHMVGSIATLERFLEAGVNAFETDVIFLKDGTANESHHGLSAKGTCQCGRLDCDEREDFKTLLRYVRSITTPGSSRFEAGLALWMMDLKPGYEKFDVEMRKVGAKLADDLIDELYPVPETLIGDKEDLGASLSQIKVQFVNNYVKYMPIATGFREEVLRRGRPDVWERVGWDFYASSVNQTIDYFHQNDVRNAWSSDGRESCGKAHTKLPKLQRLVAERDESGVFKKVYVWTFDNPESWRYVLNSTVDGVITNHPEELIQLIHTSEFARTYRLANIYDYPWRVHV